MGLDKSLFVNIDAHFLCLLCEQVLDDPVSVCSSDHLVCGDCISNLSVCPSARCSADFFDKPLTQKFVNRFIQDLPLRCSEKKSGCEWEGRAREFKEHIDNCPHYTTLCMNKHCDVIVRKPLLEAHLLTCPEGIVLCINHPRCNMKLRRKNVESHQNECKSYICKWDADGCTYKGSTRSVERHEQYCDSLHRQIEELHEQADCAQALQDRVDALNQELQELRSQSLAQNSVTTREDPVARTPDIPMVPEASVQSSKNERMTDPASSHLTGSTSSNVPPPEIPRASFGRPFPVGVINHLPATKTPHMNGIATHVLDHAKTQSYASPLAPIAPPDAVTSPSSPNKTASQSKDICQAGLQVSIVNDDVDMDDDDADVEELLVITAVEKPAESRAEVPSPQESESDLEALPPPRSNVGDVPWRRPGAFYRYRYNPTKRPRLQVNPKNAASSSERSPKHGKSQTSRNGHSVSPRSPMAQKKTVLKMSNQAATASLKSYLVSGHSQQQMSSALCLPNTKSIITQMKEKASSVPASTAAMQMHAFNNNNLLTSATNGSAPSFKLPSKPLPLISPVLSGNPHARWSSSSSTMSIASSAAPITPPHIATLVPVTPTPITVNPKSLFLNSTTVSPASGWEGFGSGYGSILGDTEISLSEQFEARYLRYSQSPVSHAVEGILG